MANRKASLDSSISKQQGLFDTGPAEGSLDIVLGLKQLLSRMLRGYDRYLVAAQISKTTLKEISKDSLDKMLSSDPAYQPSAIQVLAICKICGDNLEPFQYLLEPLGASVLSAEDHDLVEMARLQEEERKIKARLNVLMAKRGMK
ncbi:MAG: hypothetical protein FIA91_08635 [Geobacter sp.]|nr:hypothetical protein [Geobacter sp.]